jgi:hypothetical protein
VEAQITAVEAQNAAAEAQNAVVEAQTAAVEAQNAAVKAQNEAREGLKKVVTDLHSFDTGTRAEARFASVLRIHDILVWIRIRGSMPLINGSGFRSGSRYFRH